jgi:hypothetical protein
MSLQAAPSPGEGWVRPRQVLPGSPLALAPRPKLQVSVPLFSHPGDKGQNPPKVGSKAQETLPQGPHNTELNRTQRRH